MAARCVLRVAQVALPVAADLRGKEREDRMRHLDTMASITFEGAWLEDEPSVYELVLTPSSTDVKALHLWCEHSGEATRHAFVGSPFPITCTSTNVISEKIDTSGVMPGDYRIDLTVFEEAQKKWGACTIDAFASKATKLLTRFWASAVRCVDRRTRPLSGLPLASLWPPSGLSPPSLLLPSRSTSLASRVHCGSN